jgi:predicted amidophosphoribosyltransferase
MLDREAAAQLSAVLVSRAGGYLRNPVRRDHITCAVCATPVPGYEFCIQCNRHRAHAGLADAVAFLTYAVAGQQSGYVMRGYKAARPVDEHVTIVALLIVPALSTHAQCPEVLAGAPVRHWATVPFLPAKPGEHPLHRILSNAAPGHEVRLVAAASVQHPRGINPEHFRTDARLPEGSHVLLIDDTWTGGGHARPRFWRCAGQVRHTCPCSWWHAGSRKTSVRTPSSCASSPARTTTRRCVHGQGETARQPTRILPEARSQRVDCPSAAV